MDGNQRFTIDEIDDNGKPIASKKHATMFVNQCGVIVRDNLPITIQEWIKPKKAGEDFTSYVHDDAKDDLWQKLISHFILPREYEEFEADGVTPIPGGLQNRKKVKEWTLMKMAELFRNYKKNLYAKYVAKKITPEFTGALEKLREQWPDFVKYKESSVAKERSGKNKENSKKKKYHHKLGTDGYKSAVPKWEAMEADLRARGITPGTDTWPERSTLVVRARGSVEPRNRGDNFSGKNSNTLRSTS